MTSRRNLTQKSCIMVALLVLVGLFVGCNRDKSENGKTFEFLGEAIDRPENFDKDAIVTSENIDSLYRQYNVEAIFNGDYYLIRSKQSYTTSRYLSRLIQMKNGKQVAAKTFYDSDIDANAVIRLRDKIVVGINSLRKNNYDSTFHVSTHKCRIIVLSDNLTPIAGKRFYSQKGHTYIESLMQNSDSTFFCSIVSGDFEPSPYAHYQFRAHYNLNFDRQTSITTSNEYKIENEEVDFSKPDWSNDLSDDLLLTMKKQRKRIDKKAIDSIHITSKDSIKIKGNGISTYSTEIQKTPQNFVIVPSGTLKNVREYVEDREIVYNVHIDSFYICKFELTQAEYKRVVGSISQKNYTWSIQIDYKDTKIVQQGNSIPVVCTYREYAEYCNKRSKLEGYDGFYQIEGNKVKIKHNGNGYRLLNHFEWTYAAKGGNANEKYSYAGSNKVGEVAWYGGNSKYRPHEVGKKKANSLGIYDMSGNVSEMLLDDPKSSYRLVGGEGFDYWLNLGPDDILGMCDRNSRTGTRIAFVPKGMKNSNTKLTWKYRW